ncbi:M48 family metallopeptidase [Acrocarpospora catenulata]|uniref:M48 family metallopeptidase n=1 Tax=Acrocarpospora catenulata TaxID=2836182 RepID=UPI001BDA5928|nr:M48 family metallopeptidase [Acrocarpospora catenulata]
MSPLARIAAYVIAIAVHAFTLAFAGTGLLLILLNPGFLPFWLLGALLIGIGVLLRPRTARLSPGAEILSRESAPALYRLADQVAEATGVPRPEAVAVLDLGLGADFRRTGLDRRPVLTIGVPLWLALSPAQRVALLARACASTRTDLGVIVGGALTTLGEVRAALFGGGVNSSRQRAHEDMALTLGAWAPETTYDAAGQMGRGLGRLIGWPALLAEWALRRLTRGRLAQEAELARQAAERVAGQAAVRELTALLESRRYLAPLQAAALRGEDLTAIRRAALDRAELRELERVPARPDPAPALPSAAAESARVDQELQAVYARAVQGLGLLS